MARRTARLSPSAAQSELAVALANLRQELGITASFPDAVEAEARTAAAAPLGELTDLTDVEFLTIDPEGSTDLDQAMHLTATDDGFTVRYAIADVPFFVTPGGAVDTEARRRGQTLYAVDGRVPLHPPVISEDAGSLLPDRTRRAFVWQFALDIDGTLRETTLTRALVRSRRQWTYDEAQRALDDATAPAGLAPLPDIGRALLEQEAARGGASLNVPDQEVVLTGTGYDLERRMPLPVEDWNAQLSLLTGMAAARIMLDAGIGILRTMPPAPPEAVAAFRRQTELLGLPWASGVDYGEYLRTLDRADPRALAVLQDAASLFRGAGYEAFDGAEPKQMMQAALAAPYAHVTAPLRRLVDRWGLVICEAVSRGADVPEWVRASLGDLPRAMGASAGLAGRLESGTIDRIEAALLAGRIGHEFDAVVLAQNTSHTRVQLTEPAVEASVDGVFGTPGEPVRVRLVASTIPTGTLSFEPV
ncbi:RNB domain-containing ribonuclease [Microbacterium sp. CFH 90308]|uniref:RNB domain-containing ribonuclease n=1 Tax=Microbacterium salsuginis TaxID=2722803 RepID=A0ABX1KCB7_9MICO|nr:RNB domain-containing ribonuclease [Microbacterium sp. CFH 90308]NLP83745.1 RNB domain-containing ribonuclease [Microbacterium sp. CFH 90308]